MKRFLKPIGIGVGIFLTVFFLTVTVIFFIPRDNTSFSFECFRLRLSVSDFLKDVEKGRLNDAFDRVYCVSATDNAPISDSTPYRDAWTSRVASLRKDDNTYLKDFSELTVRKENGQFTVSVTLSVIRQGYNDPFYADGSVLTVVYDDGWKILSLSAYDPSLQTDLERALSGLFTAEESTGSKA
jgi:hypothetical protein